MTPLLIRDATPFGLVRIRCGVTSFTVEPRRLAGVAASRYRRVACSCCSRFGVKSRFFASVAEPQCSPARAIFLGFNPDAVVHCVLQPLSASKVLFRRLYAHMAKQKLDLLKLAARDVTEPSTRAATIPISA